MALLELEETRRQLNAYVKALHTPRFALHRSVFEAYGEVACWQKTTDIVFDIGDVTRVDALKLAQRLQLLDRFEANSLLNKTTSATSAPARFLNP